MKVIGKQRNSKMCIMCGLDNEYGVRAPFYNLEDGSVATLFSYREAHQSYPGRVHGGLITAMLDEMGLRALWAKELSEKSFGVTFSLDTKYRKPVPYGVPLVGVGKIVRDTPKFFSAQVALYDSCGNILANGTTNYMRLAPEQIAENISVHEEMCYMIPDDVKEIKI